MRECGEQSSCRSSRNGLLCQRFCLLPLAVLEKIDHFSLSSVALVLSPASMFCFASIDAAHNFSSCAVSVCACFEQSESLHS